MLINVCSKAIYYGMSHTCRDEIFKQSMEARNRVGIGLSYWPSRLHRLAEFIPWNRFLGSINFKNTGYALVPVPLPTQLNRIWRAIWVGDGGRGGADQYYALGIWLYLEMELILKYCTCSAQENIIGRVKGHEKEWIRRRDFCLVFYKSFFFY